MQDNSQDPSQDQPVWFPRYQLLYSKRPLLRRVAGAALVALVMAAALNTTAFARSVPTVAAKQDIPQQEATAVEADAGVVIVAVDEEGPAAKAGVVRGDILLMAGDMAIDSASTLFAVVTAAKPGDEVEIVVQHGDETRTIALTLGQLGDRAYLGVQVVDPPGVAVAEVEALPAVPPIEAVPGVGAEAVTATVTVGKGDAGEMMVLGAGLIVAETLADGPAAQAGLAAGDLILAIDGLPVFMPGELLAALQGHTPGEVVTLTVQKGGPVGSVITDIPITLGVAPDDPARAYLGIRFVVMAPSTSSVTIDAAPATGAYSAPAVPMLPAVPALPEAVPGYGYGYPGAYADPYPDEACGAGGVTIEQHYYPPTHGAPFAMPIAPPVYSQPTMPAAPFFIYHHGVNPEVYPYATSGLAQENVIFFHAAPAAAGVTAQRFEMATPGMVVMKKGDVVSMWSNEGAGEQAQSMWVEAQPTWTVAAPGAVPGMAFNKEVTIAKGAAKGAVKSFTVQAAPEMGVWQVAPAVDEADVVMPYAVPHAGPQVEPVQVEVNVELWY